MQPSLVLALVVVSGLVGPPATLVLASTEATTPNSTSPTPPVSAEIRTSKAEVPLGEEFEAEVVVRGPAGTTWTWPTEALGEEVELRSLARAASPGAWPPDTHRYGAVLYALGDLELPAVVVRYRLVDGTEGEVTPPKLTVRGLTVLPKSDEEPKLADVRPPVALGLGPAFLIAVGLVVAVLGVAAFFAWRFLRRRTPLVEGPSEPAPAPDVEALAALERLHSDGLPTRGDLRGHYIGLTLIAKRYLERRLGAAILEMTTAETLAFLREDARGRDCAGVMRDVSQAADSIKFARGTAAVEEAERHLGAVRSMVLEAEARLRALEAAERAALAARGSSPATPSNPGPPASGGRL